MSECLSSAFESYNGPLGTTDDTAEGLTLAVAVRGTERETAWGTVTSSTTFVCDVPGCHNQIRVATWMNSGNGKSGSYILPDRNDCEQPPQRKMDFEASAP